MINVAMLWFFLVPILLGWGIWYSVRNFHGSWVPATIFTVFGMLIIGAVFYGTSAVATADTEIWNGKITTKSRDHGTYEEPYKCRCRSVTQYSGTGNNRTSSTTEECDTCWRTHYTVKWMAHSTVGHFMIDSADELSSRVYNLPNPNRWTSIQVGDPAARSHGYTNYVQAVPESLFKQTSKDLRAQFAALIPPYPIMVYDFYRIDRFLSPGYAVTDAAKWNQDISLMLRELGPLKEVNAIVVIAKTNDPNYEYALQDAWDGANKNDVVLLIGSAEWPKIDFVRVMSWTKSELFKIELRDTVLALETIDREKIMAVLSTAIVKNFERRHMREFDYLQGQIDPPNWLLAVTAVVLVAAAGGLAYVLRLNMTRIPGRRYRTISRGPG